VSLTSGRGPLSGRPAGWFTTPIPDGLVYVEPFRRRVRGVVGDKAAVDSESVVLVHRAGHPPSYAFPRADVDGVTFEEVPDVPGYVQVPWSAVDAWFEEAERVVGHPRNPYHRIDCLKATRHLRVEAGDAVLVDTDDTLVLYETALEPKLYVHRELVRLDLLVPSPTVTYCPYKGAASHWHAQVGPTLVSDVAWSYLDPLPEAQPIAGMFSFYESRASVSHNIPAPADRP
jgi:uncharacterized protein (DUF427 family)